jgi:hypothetical protein
VAEIERCAAEKERRTLRSIFFGGATSPRARRSLPALHAAGVKPLGVPHSTMPCSGFSGASTALAAVGLAARLFARFSFDLIYGPLTVKVDQRAHPRRTSSAHTSRSGSRCSGSPWMTKVSPATVSWSPGRGLATSLARSSKVAVSA